MSAPLILPWPPSVNRLWRSVRGRNILSREGREYRVEALSALFGQGYPRPPLTGRLSVRIEAFPPDRRRRDLSNLIKAPEDLLTHGGVWLDDSQIDELSIVRREVTPGGRLVVTVTELEVTP